MAAVGGANRRRRSLRSAMAAALARLLFYPTLAYNVAAEKVSRRRWFDRVDDTVLLGALPFRSMTRQVSRTRADCLLTGPLKVRSIDFKGNVTSRRQYILWTSAP